MSRLIDADGFKNVNIESLLCFNGKPYMKVSEMFQLIKNQPTAYDIEKVVAEIKELRVDDNYECIDIVRKGGV